jgi:SAM-dependent methyltransferase
MNEFDAFVRFYDADYAAVTDDLPFYQELARRCGGPILEAMCGSGRLLEPLARAGYQLAGIDISARMIGAARDRLAAAGLLDQVQLLEGDIRDVAPRGPFGLAIVALNSFMHLTTTKAQLAALIRIREALRPGGLLALDLFNPDLRALASHNGELVLDRTFALADGTPVQKFVAQQTDTAAQLNHVTFIYDELDAQGYVRRNVLPFTMRWLYRYELEHLLARASLELEAVYGSYELDEYSTESPLMLAVARRSDDKMTR